jgi:acetyl-CoA C-acetyltransferase
VADKAMGLRSKEVTMRSPTKASARHHLEASARSAQRCPAAWSPPATPASSPTGAGLRADERSYAEQKGLQPLGHLPGFAVAGCEPDEMGIGPVFAVPKVLARLGLKVHDIDLWELNEAFAVQVLYCRDKLGIPTTGSTSTAAPSRWATPTASAGSA